MDFVQTNLSMSIFDPSRLDAVHAEDDQGPLDERTPRIDPYTVLYYNYL